MPDTTIIPADILALHPGHIDEHAAKRVAELCRANEMSSIAEIDRLINGHGLEGVSAEGCDVRNTTGDDGEVAFTYSNAGDTYTATVAYNHSSERFEITTYADMLEAAQASSEPESDEPEPDDTDETPNDFEPELTLECDGLTCRIAYRDDNSYHGTLEVDGLIWYWSDLRPPQFMCADSPMQDGYDCEAALRHQARVILSFAGTDELEAECRAPEAFQSAIEAAECGLMGEEGSDDDEDGELGSRWTVIDSSDSDGDDEPPTLATPTSSSACRVWVGCLASYNAGKLHGEWIDVDGDVDDLQAAVDAMLEVSPTPNAEEWHICDHEGFGPVKIGEYETLESVAILAAVIGTHGAIVVSVALDSIGADDPSPSDFDDWVSDHYEGVYDSLEAWAEDYHEQCGTFQDVPDGVSRYFDFARWAHDCQCNGYTTVIDGPSVHIFRP